MQFNITFKTIFEYVLKKLVLCIQIRFVSTEKTTRIASRASCFIGCLLLNIFSYDLTLCNHFVTLSFITQSYYLSFKKIHLGNQQTRGSTL